MTEVRGCWRGRFWLTVHLCSVGQLCPRWLDANLSSSGFCLAGSTLKLSSMCQQLLLQGLRYMVQQACQKWTQSSQQPHEANTVITCCLWVRGNAGTQVGSAAWSLGFQSLYPRRLYAGISPSYLATRPLPVCHLCTGSPFFLPNSCIYNIFVALLLAERKLAFFQLL